MATLKLERRGCDYFGTDAAREDGIGNYRVVCEFVDKKGTDIFVEFTRGLVYEFTYRGKPRKKPKKVSDWGIHVDAQYTAEDGYSYMYGMGRKVWNSVRETPWYGMEWNIDSILKLVNNVSAETYTDVEFVDHL